MKNPTRTILVAGSNGQLGSELKALAPRFPEYKFLFTDLAELDITDPAAVAKMCDAEQPGWIINAAAYTAVDKAETDREKAELLNAGAVAILAGAAERGGAGFVHISTDYVFSGEPKEALLTEEDPTEPRSVYGQTKLRGEQAALAYAGSIVVRTSWLYSAHGSNFVKTMMRLGSERSEIGVVADQWGSPTWAADLADALMRMIARTGVDEGNSLCGLYQYCNNGATNWYDFASQVMLQCGLECTVVPIATAEYPTAAPRPAYSVMSTAKIRDAFGLEIPEWETSLERCLAQIAQSKDV